MRQNSNQVMRNTGGRKYSKFGRMSLKKHQADRLQQLDIIAQNFDPYSNNKKQKSVYSKDANKGKTILMKFLEIRYTRIVSNTLKKSNSANKTAKVESKLIFI